MLHSPWGSQPKRVDEEGGRKEGRANTMSKDGQPHRLFNPRTSRVMQLIKNSPANAGDARDAGLTSGLGTSPGGGNGNPLQ